MALLNQSQGFVRRFRVLLVLLTLAASLAVGGCAIANVFGLGSKPLTFPHARHIQEGIECGDCHTGTETAENPGMPQMAPCKICHDELDKNRPPERAITNLFDGPAFRAAHATKLVTDVIFSHQKHVVAKLDCAVCHIGIADNQAVDSSLGVRMRACVDCHAEKQVAKDCNTCHTTIRIDERPPTHAFAWNKLHGKTARAKGSATADNCSMCHTESTCRDCHQNEPPESHDNYFRHRAHGLFARMDRESCSACHRQDSCDKCHSETPPVNHVGAFAGTRQTHCVSCHFPVRTTDCYTCHQDTPSHATATPLPATHNAGMNCRMCHGQGQVLPHVDKGDSCTICHR